MNRCSKTLLYLVTCLVTAQAASAATLPPREAAVKATFLVKFTSYIDWPKDTLSAGQPVVLCVYGQDPFGQVLDRAALQHGGDERRVIIRRISMSVQINSCHLAYVGGTARNVSQAITSVNYRPVVTITDAQISNLKGVVHFQIVAGKVRFEINDIAARRSGLNISSQLLGLALSVRSER